MFWLKMERKLRVLIEIVPMSNAFLEFQYLGNATRPYLKL